MLGESFKYVAPLAGTLGYTAEDTAVALGLMANSGIKASQAGTTLRTAITNLASPTKEQAAEMERLHISLTDSNGQMLPMLDMVGDLRAAFTGMSEAEQSAAASTIFGKEAMSGMLAIINASEADYPVSFQRLSAWPLRGRGSSSGTSGRPGRQFPAPHRTGPVGQWRNPSGG